MDQTEPLSRLFAVLNRLAILAYKSIGLLALGGILAGLAGFLTVNVFYLFDRSWIRPVVLSPSHERVLEANGTLIGQIARRDDLVGTKLDLEAELAAIARTIESNERFERDYRSALAGEGYRASSLEALMARQALDRSVLESQSARDRQTTIARRIEKLEDGIGRYDRVIEQIQLSAYIRATERPITVAFVPYQNLDQIEPGATIYGCALGLAFCSRVGAVVSLLEGEVTESHPQKGGSMRGLMLEIDLVSPDAAERRALFVGKRPFWIL